MTPPKILSFFRTFVEAHPFAGASTYHIVRPMDRTEYPFVPQLPGVSRVFLSIWRYDDINFAERGMDRCDKLVRNCNLQSVVACIAKFTNW